jgi:two-component system phosphate regulon sensor histidine kinase PhoR
MADEVRGRLLDQIESQVQALSQLSQEMLDLAQIESGQVMLRLVPVELGAVVRQALAQLEPQAVAKRQRLSVLVPPSLTALADVQQAARVIGNLVHNAVKFTPEGGSIRIEAEPVGEDVLLRVTDSGPGIPPAERSRVFERFYKADRARTKGGTGLGLAIARHIVEGHGGRIWVESAPGGGAQFCFTLPRA